MSNRWRNVERGVERAWTGMYRPSFHPAIWRPAQAHQKLGKVAFGDWFSGDANVGRLPWLVATRRTAALLIGEGGALNELLASKDIRPALGRLLARRLAGGDFEEIRFDVGLLADQREIGYVHERSEALRGHGVLIGPEVHDPQGPEGQSLSWRYAIGGLDTSGTFVTEGNVRTSGPIPVRDFGVGSWLKDTNFS